MSSKEDALSEQLHGRAQETTRLDDWGRDDSYRDGLNALLGDVVNLPAPVQEVAQDQIVGLLSTRLHLERDATAEPGILDQEIGAPLVVIGLPRTGTSLLFELLQFDPDSRCPMVWEASFPSPASGFAQLQRRPAHRPLRGSSPQPGGPGPPSVRTGNAAECHAITMLHFDSAYFVAFMEVPRYREWMLSHRDFTLFRTHRRILQQFQYRGPRGRWTLKSPQHPLNLEPLIEAYPGAMLIQTHRDPLTSMSSLASLIRATRRPLYPDSDPHKLGAEIIDTWTTVLERGIAARKDPAVDAAIFDLDYRDLVADPLRSVEQIYDRFGLPMGSQHRERIREFLAAGSGTGHGSHQYSPDEFGIRRPELLARIPNYADRFASLVTAG